MVGQFRLQRSLQDCFRELFQKAVLADDVFRLLVIGQQLINECLVDGHRFPFSSSDGRLHSPFYTLLRSFKRSLITLASCGNFLWAHWPILAWDALTPSRATPRRAAARTKTSSRCGRTPIP